MSHIHLPDGIISPIWWVSGFIITFCIVYFILRSIDHEKARQKIPHTGVAAAIMLLGMSVPLFIVPVHLSLAVLTGILIGPKLGFLAVLVVNFILAFVGHGGITLVGLNTLIFGVEVLVGYSIFRALTKKGNYTIGTMVATSIAVIISMTMTVSFIGFTAGFTEALPHHHHGEHSHLEEDHKFEDKGLFVEESSTNEEGLFAEERSFNKEGLFDEEYLLNEERLFAEERLLEEEQLFDEDRLIEEERLFTEEPLLEDERLLNETPLVDEEHSHHGDLMESVKGIKYFALTGWTAVFAIFIAGILLESIGTTLIIKYFIKVRPGIVASVEYNDQNL